MCSSIFPGRSILQELLNKVFSGKNELKNVQTEERERGRGDPLALEWCAHVKQFSQAPKYSEYLFERGQVISCPSD